MSVSLRQFDVRTLGKVLAAVLVGLSIGTMIPPEPMVVPVVGPVSSIVVGGIGVVVGTALYTRMPGSSGCGCSGECDCN